MIWFFITTVDGQKRLINGNQIIDVYYSAETDMTTITLLRAQSPSFYVRGNVMSELSKLIARNEHCVLYNIGDK